jgi:hypothetical protein
MRARLACVALGLATPAAAHTDPAPFDLTGPTLQASVMHDGKTLPIAAVPNLAIGDQITIRADLPADQSAHYLLVVAFLRGATNPPPKNWFYKAESWTKNGRAGIRVIVPAGAQQVVVLMAPETGGDFDTLVGAVRGRPGAFVRASQDLNQVALDRSRLDAFLQGIHERDPNDPDRLARVSPLLARSLAIKLNADCLQRVPELQSACLTQNQDSLVLNDGHSTSITEALAAGPTADLALQISATPQGGLGYYSPYIAAIRDIVGILGSFHSAQFQYIPALGMARGDRLSLVLNAAPSFHNPKSVLMTALPAIQPPVLPPLQATAAADGLCAQRPDLVLPVDGAPLIYSAGYAHDLVLRLRAQDGQTIDLPVRADAEKGGLVVDTATFDAKRFGTVAEGALHGSWGFATFDGPRFRLENGVADGWKSTGDLQLEGGSAACVQSVSLRTAGGEARPVPWKATAPDRLSVAAPAAGATALLIQRYGVRDPLVVPVQSHEATKPGVTLIARTVQPATTTSPIPIRLGSDAALPQDARLAFSVRAAPGTSFTGREAIEVATADGAASTTLTMAAGLTRADANVLLARLDPARMLGASAFGPLRFRIVQGAAQGDWQPLVTLVRLPTLRSLTCPADPQAPCTLEGGDLFLIDTVSTDPGFAHPVAVPGGFTGSSLQIPRPASGKFYLKMRDDPQAIDEATAPA